MALLIRVIANGGKPSLSVGARKTFQEGLQSALFKKLLSFRYRLAATQLIGEMKRDAPRDTGKIANAHGHAVDMDNLKLLIFNRAGYSAFVHEGRKPGKPPPVAALFAWARRKVVNNRLKTQRLFADVSGGLVTFRKKTAATNMDIQEAWRLAFLVSRVIAKRGTKPQPWFQGVLERSGLSVVVAQVTKAVDDFNQVLVVGMAEEAKAKLDAGLGNQGNQGGGP